MLWLASPTWACKLLLVHSNVDKVNIEWEKHIGWGPPFSPSPVLSPSPPFSLSPRLSLRLSLPLSPCLDLLYVKCSSIRVHSPKALIVVWQPVYTILQLSDTGGSKPVTRRNLVGMHLNNRLIKNNNNKKVEMCFSEKKQNNKRQKNMTFFLIYHTKFPQCFFFFVNKSLQRKIVITSKLTN